jgi:2-polyprenyl-3-methyl-5-hydroxy-6-metoxy-1,4-benzoquinol methylase
MSTAALVEKKLLNTLHDRAVFRRRVRVLSTLLAGELGSNGTVLDLGCGDGSIAQAIMERKPGLSFHGIDVLVRDHSLIPVTLFDGRTIPAEDKSFDWVTIVDVLHHTDDPTPLVEEAARVARQGVVIKDHLREGFAAYETLRLMDWVGNKGHGVRLPLRPRQIIVGQALFTKAGITAQSWRESLSLYPFPATLIFDRGLHFIARLR